MKKKESFKTITISDMGFGKLNSNLEVKLLMKTKDNFEMLEEELNNELNNELNIVLK
jgi:hypothetical protein